MRHRVRQEGAWSPDGTADHTLIEWDDETGAAEIAEHAADGTLLRQFQWRPQDDGRGALVVELDPAGREVGRTRNAGPARGW